MYVAHQVSNGSSRLRRVCMLQQHASAFRSRTARPPSRTLTCEETRKEYGKARKQDRTAQAERKPRHTDRFGRRKTKNKRTQHGCRELNLRRYLTAIVFIFIPGTRTTDFCIVLHHQENAAATPRKHSPHPKALSCLVCATLYLAVQCLPDVGVTTDLVLDLRIREQ